MAPTRGPPKVVSQALAIALSSSVRAPTLALSSRAASYVPQVSPRVPSSLWRRPRRCAGGPQAAVGQMARRLPLPRWLKVGRSRRRDASVVGRRSRRRQVAAGTPGRAVGRVLAANRASAVLRGSSPLSHGPAWAGRWRAEARASCRADERLSVAWRASLLASGFADGCRLREPGPGSCRCDSVRRRGGSG